VRKVSRNSEGTETLSRHGIKAEAKDFRETNRDRINRPAEAKVSIETQDQAATELRELIDLNGVTL
jgi:hypothetical protein